MMASAFKARLDPFHLHAIIHAEKAAHDLWPKALLIKFRAYAARWDYTKPIDCAAKRQELFTSRNYGPRRDKG